MGRPREFDRDDALQIAMKLFWQRGYEGVSVANLTAAMNIAMPSFYAAFGSKANLYREALECYQRRPGAVSTYPLEIDLPIRDAVERVLRLAIATVTELSPSSGCMIANGLLVIGAEHSELAELTANLRRGLIAALEKRLELAVEHGELTARNNSRTLARYFAAIVQGIAVQGRDGIDTEELNDLVQLALDSLPLATATPTQSARRRTHRKLRAGVQRNKSRRQTDKSSSSRSGKAQ